MNKLNFTKATLEKLPIPTKGKRASYFDTKTRGLALRITDRGTRSFVVYRWIKGRPERLLLGRYPDLTIEQARGKASEINGAVARQENPADAKRYLREEPALSDLLRDFLEHRRNKRGAYLSASTKHNYQQDFNCHLTALAHRKLSDITKQDVARLHAKIGRTAPYSANRVLALLSSLYSYATHATRFSGTSPTAGITKFPETHRERFVQPDEMPRFFKALAEEDSDFRDVFLLALLTGARRGNVLAMRRQEVNVERAEWYIPNTKNQSGLTISLVPEAIAILQRRLEAVDGDYLFPGKGKSGHLVEPKTAWRRVLARADIQELRLHDLRHTIGSALAATGANIAMSMQALGHKTQQASLIYQKLHRDPIREAMGRATDSILAQAGVKPSAELRSIKRSRK